MHVMRGSITEHLRASITEDFALNLNAITKYPVSGLDGGPKGTGVNFRQDQSVDDLSWLYSRSKTIPILSATSTTAGAESRSPAPSTSPGHSAVRSRFARSPAVRQDCAVRTGRPANRTTRKPGA